LIEAGNKIIPEKYVTLPGYGSKFTFSIVVESSLLAIKPNYFFFFYYYQHP